MFEDEWGMRVNAPAPSPPGVAAPAHDPLPQFLLPGEVVLWQGRPRQGAGWRCMLRHRDAWLAAAAVLPLAIYGAETEGRMGLKSLLALPALAVVALAVVVIMTGRHLARVCYVVTDQRAFSLGGPVDPWRMLSVRRGASIPRRRHTRCGTTIDLGNAVVGRGYAERWLRSDGSWLNRTRPRDESPRLSFRALELAEAPFDLLMRLSRSDGPVRDGIVIPMSQGGAA